MDMNSLCEQSFKKQGILSLNHIIRFQSLELIHTILSPLRLHLPLYTLDIVTDSPTDTV